MELSLSGNIRSFRKERRLTQEQLAEVLGVTTGAVYKWESGLSVPELPMIVALADFFDTSVDVLLGYRIKDNSLAAIADRLNACCRNGDPAAIAEAEKALKKYPNSFTVVYGCAQVYHVFGAEGRNNAYLRRALALYEQALPLISQNDDPYVGEHTVYGAVGEIYILMDEPEKGLEILKKHNADGMFDDTIGNTLSVLLRRPEEARPFLFNSLLRIVFNFQSAVIGYAFLYAARGDHAAEAGMARWGLDVLRGLQTTGEPGFPDKMIAVLLLLLAHALLHGGNPEEARAAAGRAAALARAFDAAPYYGVARLRFSAGTETGSMHDGMGGTAAESAAYLLERLRDPALTSLWEEAVKNLKEENT